MQFYRQKTEIKASGGAWSSLDPTTRSQIHINAPQNTKKDFF